jgi:hypothetical protein
VRLFFAFFDFAEDFLQLTPAKQQEVLDFRSL